MSDPTKDKVEEPTAEYGKVYTYADYLKFGTEKAFEIIRGKLIRMAPAPNTRHQEISVNLVLAIGNILKGSKCKLFHAPFDVILPIKDEKKNTATTVLQPDLCIICESEKIEKEGCFGPPDLIIEILSPTTIKNDFQDKFEIYEEAGVKEYWIVSPLNRSVQIFVLKTKYELERTPVGDDLVQSSILPTISINLNTIFSEE